MNAELATLLSVLVRVSAWTFAAPVIGGPQVPPKVKVGVAILLALLVAPVRPAADPDAVWLALPLEAGLGFITGFAGRLAILGAEAAGQLVGMSIGVGFAAFYDPASGEEALPTRRIAGTLAGLAFVSVDGLAHTLRALALVPELPAGALGALLPQLVDASAAVLVTSVRAAAPILVAALVANAAMAFASRAAPALNAFSVMLTLFLVVGGVVLIATAPAFAHELVRAGSTAARAAEHLLAP